MALALTALVTPALAGILKEVKQGHQQQADHDPDREVPEIGIHRGSFMPWAVMCRIPSQVLAG